MEIPDCPGLLECTDECANEYYERSERYFDIDVCDAQCLDSGIDNLIATFGGSLSYQRFPKSPKKASFAFHEKPRIAYSVWAVNTGVQRETRKAVAMVKAKLSSKETGKATKGLLHGIGHGIR